MRVRRKQFLAVACLVAGFVLVTTMLFNRQPREPRYNGRSLSEWARAYSTYGVPTAQADEADEAIRKIGTNALPHLLRWIAYDLPRWRGTVASASPSRLKHWALATSGRARADLAVLAFKALGPTASNAVPELLRLAQSQPNGELRERARSALNYTRLPEAEALLTRTARLPKIAPEVLTNSPPQ